MKKKGIAVLLFAIYLVLGLQGVTPQKWELRSKDDFLKGKFEGISITTEGVLSLSPREEEKEGPAEEFYLSFLLAADGDIYLGTGHEGKIYRIAKDGSIELYFQAPEMDVTALAVDRKGLLFAGTSPNGKIYKISAKNKGDVFFNPDEKYIWDLLFTDDGNLKAAVGESGGIYEINPQGEGKLILRAEENHILCLRLDRNGELIAGSAGSGLVYRISKTGKASVLFEPPFEEIKSIALDSEGNIYAAASGTPIRTKKEEPLQISISTDVSMTVTPAGSQETAPVSLDSRKQPSALYRIDTAGMAKRLWTSGEELIYTLLWNEEGKKILFGTGNQGRMYAADGEGNVSLLIQKRSEQIYGLYPSGARIYVVANNPPLLSVLHPEQRFSGEYLSPVLNAGLLSSWGRVSWDAELPAGTTLQVQTRSGNSGEPNKTWSDWSPPYQKKESEQVLSPRARFLQFKILFKTQSGKISPLLHKISLFYLQTNVPPVIARLELFPPNEVFLKPPEQEEMIWGLERSSVGSPPKKVSTNLHVAKKVERQGFQTLVWDAEDENGDNLEYAVFIRKEGEAQWRLLEDQKTETLFAFDTVIFPDGIYLVKVVASDLPSNPKGQELKAEKTSSPLVIDNTPPQIKNVKVVRDKNKLEVSFQAEDAFSAIKEAMYLIKPGDWGVVFPEDGICDSRLESFKIRITLPPDSDNLITIKVADSQNNVAVHRETF